MLNSLIIAFAMYSKIPMKRVEWNEKNMRYSLCFFPLVGAVVGGCELLCFYILHRILAGRVMTAAFMTALPILISGGIHMDGFLDTVDAKSSFRKEEERLKILKDPHVGAFAVIFGIVYLLLTFSCYYEITERELTTLAVGYVFERVLSGLSLLTLKGAKKDGMAASFVKASEKSVKWIMAAEALICMAVFLVSDPVYGVCCIVTGALCFFRYRNMAYRYFGGVTGDLAGYFLQVCEFMMLMALVFLTKLSAA